MNRYVCTSCGQFCYSAADYERESNNNCPYEDCSGHVVPAPEERICRVKGNRLDLLNGVSAGKSNRYENW